MNTSAQQLTNARNRLAYWERVAAGQTDANTFWQAQSSIRYWSRQIAAIMDCLECEPVQS